MGCDPQLSSLLKDNLLGGISNQDLADEVARVGIPRVRYIRGGTEGGKKNVTLPGLVTREREK